MSTYESLKGMINKGMYVHAEEMQGKLDYFYKTRKKLTLAQYNELTELLASREEGQVEEVAKQL